MTVISKEEIRAFRRMTPAEKLEQIALIHMQARAWKRAALRKQHPDWTNEQIEQRVKEIFLYGTG